MILRFSSAAFGAVTILSLIHNSVAQAIPGVNGQEFREPRVVITMSPIRVETAQPVSVMTWTLVGRVGFNRYYCVSEVPTQHLRFICTNCFDRNITDMETVLNAAVDMSRSTGFPTLALENVPVNRNWTGLQIVCQAQVAEGQEYHSNQASVQVQYLNRPRVLDESMQAPVEIANQGSRFFVECIRNVQGQCQENVGKRKKLFCGVDAHPAASDFRWMRNGLLIPGSSESLTIGSDYIGQSVQCQANNGLYSQQEMPTSLAVQIDPYTSARVLLDNYELLRQQSPFRPGNKLQLEDEVQLACQVEGNPRPVVFWKQKGLDQVIRDADCAQGFDGINTEVKVDDLSRPIDQNIVRLNALCNLRVRNYSFTGDYWCSACSYVSKGVPECNPPLNQMGEKFLQVNVIGAPLESDAPPTIFQDPRGSGAIISVPYCANPEPRPPREVVFVVDRTDIQAGQEWENFRFDGQTTNTTFRDCYVARLRLDPVTEYDQSRDIYLKVQNIHGTKQIPVSLRELLGNGVSTGGLSGWWIALIVLVCLGILLAVALLFCYLRRMVCFRGTKSASGTSGSRSKKDGSAGYASSYATNLAPQHYASEPPPPRQTYIGAPSYPTHRTTTTDIGAPSMLSPEEESMDLIQRYPVPRDPPKKRNLHEGLNYAELDLTDGNNRTNGYYNPQPMDYAHVQAISPSSYGSRAPSTNSVV